MAPSTHSADVSQIQTDTAAILVDTGTTIPGTITTVDTNVDAILVDTGTTLPAGIAVVDANVDSILVDTGTTLPATLDAGLVSGSTIYKGSAVTTTASVYTGLWTIILGGDFDADSTFFATLAMVSTSSTAYGTIYVNAIPASSEFTCTTTETAFNLEFTADPGDKVELRGKATPGQTSSYVGFSVGGSCFAGDAWGFV